MNIHRISTLQSSSVMAISLYARSPAPMLAGLKNKNIMLIDKVSSHNNHCYLQSVFNCSYQLFIENSKPSNACFHAKYIMINEGTNAED